MQAEHVSNLGLQLFKPPCCGKQKLRACFEQGHQCTATGPPRNSHVEWAVGEFPHRKKAFPASVDRYLTSASLNESRMFMAQRSGRGGKSRQRTLCCHSCREVGEIQEKRGLMALSQTWSAGLHLERTSGLKVSDSVSTSTSGKMQLLPKSLSHGALTTSGPFKKSKTMVCPSGRALFAHRRCVPTVPKLLRVATLTLIWMMLLMMVMMIRMMMMLMLMVLRWHHLLVAANSRIGLSAPPFPPVCPKQSALRKMANCLPETIFGRQVSPGLAMCKTRTGDTVLPEDHDDQGVLPFETIDSDSDSDTLVLPGWASPTSSNPGLGI
eukprot:s1929_g13.t1